MTKVLIVDDAAFARMRISKIVQRLGYNYIEAEDGKEALKMFEKETPDLTLMDITMPGLDGLSALKRIISKNPEARVIMITNVGQQSTITEALKLGAKSFIRKPFSEDKLIETIMNVMSE